MVRNVSIVLSSFVVLVAVLFAVQPMLFARALDKKGEIDPVEALRLEQQEAREKQQKEIDALIAEIKVLETKIETLDDRFNDVNEAEAGLREILDEMHGLVKKKEGLDKDLGKKKKTLKKDERKRTKKAYSLKTNLIKKKRKLRVSKLKKDVRKYEKIIASPAIEDMDVEDSAWKALMVKYPKVAKGIKVGDVEELKFRVIYGGRTNSIGMKFVLILSGKFNMGSPDNEQFRSNDEINHKVKITKPFYLQTTEVTQEQWVTIMGKNPSEFIKKGKNNPVENVGWDDCQVFIKKLNKLERTNKYRLPTEAEWEYACRAGKSSAFAGGDITVKGCGQDPVLDAMGWYCWNAWRKTHAVAKKKINSWGLYDMHGNVWEWCGDWFGNYSKDSASDPKGARFGPERVIRGGSFRNNAEKCRSAFRFSYKVNIKLNHLGFRVARTL